MPNEVALTWSPMSSRAASATVPCCAVHEAAALVQRALPALTEDEGLEFVGALASLAGAVWQIANPGPVLAELYASDPELSHACVDLVPRLRRTAEILLAGLVASRSSVSSGPYQGRN